MILFKILKAILKKIAKKSSSKSDPLYKCLTPADRLEAGPVLVPIASPNSLS